MKTYQIYVCEKCGKESRNRDEILQCEAEHFGLPATEYDYFYFPVANNVCAGRVVFTKNLLDVGLVAETQGGKPKKVYARINNCRGFSRDITHSQYGGIEHVCWYDSGVDMTYEQWEKLSVDTADARGFYQYWKEKLKRMKE